MILILIPNYLLMYVLLPATVLAVSCITFGEKHTAVVFVSHVRACHYAKDQISPVLQANKGKGVAEQDRS